MSKAVGQDGSVDHGEAGRQTVSDLLFELWRTGGITDALPAGLAPASRRDAYAIQALIEKRSARPRFGWKIAATSKAGQAHIGIGGPIAGRLIAERAFADAARLRFGANRMRVAEPEFAFRFGRDIVPRDAPYGVEEVLAAVASLHPAIEIPNFALRRFRPYRRVRADRRQCLRACVRAWSCGASQLALF